MGIQLFLEIFDVIHDIVQLLLVTRFRTHQVFLSLLLGLSRGDLLFQDSDLLTDIRLANIYRAKAGRELHLPQKKLGAIHVTHDGAGIQAIALLDIQFHDLTVGFRRYQDLGCLKGTGSVKIIVCITASRP